jgi:hypothetical protein
LRRNSVAIDWDKVLRRIILRVLPFITIFKFKLQRQTTPWSNNTERHGRDQSGWEGGFKHNFTVQRDEHIKSHPSTKITRGSRRAFCIKLSNPKIRGNRSHPCIHARTHARNALLSISHLRQELPKFRVYFPLTLPWLARGEDASFRIDMWPSMNGAPLMHASMSKLRLKSGGKVPLLIVERSPWWWC